MKYPYRTELERVQAAQRQAEEYVNQLPKVGQYGWANLVTDLQKEYLMGSLTSEKLADRMKEQASAAPSEWSKILEFVANPNPEAEVDDSHE